MASKSALLTYHPLVAFTFFIGAIGLSMACMHPVYVCLSFAGAFLCSCTVKGWSDTARSLVWIIPMWLVLIIANPFFVSSGSTELFHTFLGTVYWEAVVYGFCSGGMLASVFLWFMAYAHVMTSENTMALLGNVIPVISVMITQVMRLVPQFVKRGHDISQVHEACSAAAPQEKKDGTKARLRIVSILMSWGMEDGIERSQSMLSRGYGCGVKRTTYKRYSFSQSDMVLLGITLFLGILSACFAWMECSRFEFYPVLSQLTLWVGYFTYGLFLVIPGVLQGKEWWQWRLLK